MWVDAWDTSVGVGDGKLTDAAACKTSSWGTAVWAWDPASNAAGFIMNDDSDGTYATLRVVDVRAGAPAGPTAGMCDFGKGCIQKDAHVTYNFKYPGDDIVTYAIGVGSTMTDGLWAYNKLPWSSAPPPMDAGTDTGGEVDAGDMDAGDVDGGAAD